MSDSNNLPRENGQGLDSSDFTLDADAMIAVMGSTGTGKSSFIKLITGDEKIIIGHGQESQTDQISLSQYVELNGRCVTLVDTPGFDDSREGVTDTDILKMIAAFLDAEFKDGRKLSGIIYMHRISDVRVGGISRRNLRMFQKLCGSESLKNVIIATTMWDSVSEEVGAKRESELKTKDSFFKPLLDCGARLVRHHDECSSALDIVSELLARQPLPLAIQTELRDGKNIMQTAAGSELNAELMKLIEKHQAEMRELRAEMMVALRERDEKSKRELEEEREKLASAIKRWEEDKQKLEEGLESVRAAAEAQRKAVQVEADKRRAIFCERLEQDRKALAAVKIRFNEERTASAALHLASEGQKIAHVALKICLDEEDRTRQQLQDIQRKRHELENQFERETRRRKELEAKVQCAREMREESEAELYTAIIEEGNKYLPHVEALKRHLVSGWKLGVSKLQDMTVDGSVLDSAAAGVGISLQDVRGALEKGFSVNGER